MKTVDVHEIEDEIRDENGPVEPGDGDLPPRWRWVGRATGMKPSWHAVFNPDRDCHRDGDRYMETAVYKAYRLVVQAGAALADAEELAACYPAFGLLLDDLATALLAAEEDQGPLAADLSRRADYFYARSSQDGSVGARHPSAARTLASVLRLGDLCDLSGEEGASRYVSWCAKDVVPEIREAIREPGFYCLHRVARSLADIAVEALLADMPEKAEDLANEAIALYKIEFDVSESSDYSAIAYCHGIVGWSKADRGDRPGALVAYREALEWYRATQAVNPDSAWIYHDDVADACYCVAFLDGDMRRSRELLLEAARIYGRGVCDERNVSGLIRTYLLLAELEEEASGPSEPVEAALYRTKAESIRSRLASSGIECCRNWQLDESLGKLAGRHGAEDSPHGDDGF